MTEATPDVVAFGDAALLVSFEQRIDAGVNDGVHSLAARISAARLEGAAWHAPVPAYASILAPYDPLRLMYTEARAAMDALLASLPAARPAGAAPDQASAEAPATLRPTIDIPVHYGGDDGPDLAEVAERTGLTAAQVVELHASTTYRAYFLGFAPGFAYLATLPAALHVPRRATPRPRVAAGSVAIAGGQTAVYPQATPGGWLLIGRTEAAIWDPLRDPPQMIQAGQQVRFVPLAG